MNALMVFEETVNVFSLMVFAGDCECVLTDGVCRRL